MAPGEGDRLDVVVVGLGVAGATTLWSLAERGLRVVGVEQHEPGHALGGSHGGSRLFRRLHWEGAHYPALAERSRARYRQLEAESGARLLTPCRHAVVGPDDGPLVRRTLAVAFAAGTRAQVLQTRAAVRAVPQLALRADDAVVLDHDAAVVDPEATVRAAVGCARARGADVVVRQTVRAVVDGADEIHVVLDDRELRTRRVVLATGAWLGSRVAGVRARRAVQAWFRPVDPTTPTGPDAWPAFVREGDGGRFWGLPDVDGRGVKVGGSSQPTDPDSRDPVSAAERSAISGFVRAGVPSLAADPVEARACVDGYTDDGDFLVGPVAGSSTLLVCGGFSGHGFTHAGAIGDLTAALCGPGALSDLDADLLAPHDPTRTLQEARHG